MKLEVSIPRQTLDVFEDRQIIRTFPVSTSRYGPGEEEGSHCTPRGLHRICEKVGDGEPTGTIFRGRCPTGELWTPDSPVSDQDLILTRILRLDGLEPRNCNSHDRYIYLHGTNREDQIGHPASIGCIRLRNMDILALYDMIPLNTEVLIRDTD